MSEEGGADPTYTMFPVRGKPEPIQVIMQVNSVNLEMEVDTGASCSIISAATYGEPWPRDQAPPLYKTEKRLHLYEGVSEGLRCHHCHSTLPRPDSGP